MNKISDINLIGKLACKHMSTTSKVMVGASWVILNCNPSNKCRMCAWITCAIAAIGCIVYKRGESKGMHACMQTKQLQFWSNTMFNVEFDPWMCMIFKEDIYVHDCYLNGWCSGHRPNLRRVVIGWTMTFKTSRLTLAWGSQELESLPYVICGLANVLVI